MKIDLLSTQNLSVAQTTTLKDKITAGIVTTADLAEALNPPRLKLTAVCSDLSTESDRLADFTLDNDSYEPGDTVTVTVSGAVIPGTVTDYDTTLTYPFSAWWDGETFDPSPSKTVTIDETGTTGLTAVFNVIPVATVEDLKTATVNTSGNYYLQVADIDLSSEPWWGGVAVMEVDSDKIQFGNGSSFTGMYDGGGHSISNMKLKKMEYSGLFGALTNSTIVNLNVECLGFNNASTNSASWGGGILAGRIKGNNTVLIANVTTMGRIGDNEHHTCHNTGGVTSRVAAKTIMVNVFNFADVYASRSSNLKMGGLVGYLENSIEMVNCANYGTLVTSTDNIGPDQNYGIGGLIGGTMTLVSQPINLTGCKSCGLMEMPDNNTAYGSIVGWMRNGSIIGGEVSTLYKIYPNAPSDVGFGKIGRVDKDTGAVILLQSAPVLNTDDIYKTLADGCSVNLLAEGDYIIIDSSVQDADDCVKYAAGTVSKTEYKVGNKAAPNIFIYTATAS